MKKFKILKIIGIIVGGLLVILIGVILYITNFLPNIPVKDIKVAITKERLERGKYLANHVSVCMDCHSTRDWTKFSGPLVAGTEGKGGEEFNREMGLPGVYYSRNITPAGIGSWSDGEIYRAITSGVGKNGRPLFPLMPFNHFGKMDTEDIYSIIAYIRSLAPLENHTPDPTTDFPVNIFLHMMQSEASPQAAPSKTDKIKYGAYMVNAAGCFDCHTNYIKGEFIKGMEFAGGREFKLPNGTVRTANLTPDVETGIGSWTQDNFVARFKTYDMSQVPPPELKLPYYQTIMPWTMYAGMEKEDLEAVYAYLRTLKPIVNKVTKFDPR